MLEFNIHRISRDMTQSLRVKKSESHAIFSWFRRNMSVHYPECIASVTDWETDDAFSNGSRFIFTSHIAISPGTWVSSKSG